MIVDSQVHVWTPGAGDPSRDPSGVGVSGADTLALMDAAGIAAAVIVSPSSIYGFDSSFALGVAGDHPDRFRVVGPVDVTDPGAIGFVERWAADPRTVGLRLFARDAAEAAAAQAPHGRAVLAAVAAQGLPLNVWAPYVAGVSGDVARAHPDLRIVIDHTGLAFKPGVPPLADRLADVGERVLALGALPNVSVKLTGLPALSAEPYPFRDVWPWAEKLVAAFGPGRVLWGTDWTRVDRCDHPQGLSWLTGSGLFGAAELDLLLGGAARATYAWPA